MLQIRICYRREGRVGYIYATVTCMLQKGGGKKLEFYAGIVENFSLVQISVQTMISTDVEG